MFSRGNWAVFAVNPNNEIPFSNHLESALTMLHSSAAAAGAVARVTKTEAIGINPFQYPRLDESEELQYIEQQKLIKLRGLAKEDRHLFSLVDISFFGTVFGIGAAQYKLEEHRYGFWFVFNEWKDTGDIASLKESKAYAGAERPYKFLGTPDKKTVDAEVTCTSAIIRKQFPVIIDFSRGLVFAETTSKTHLQLLQSLLMELDADPSALAWRFGEGDWIRPFLETLYEESRYKDSFRKRAEDRSRMNPDEVEPFEDRELEGIVKKTFSMTELENEEWIGLAAPARIRLYTASDPVAVQSPTNATQLLGHSDSAHVFDASLVFQERITRTNKKGEEVTYRNDLFALVLNDNMNELEAGTALLRGFDLPRFKKQIQKEIRKTKQVPPIAKFWADWLREMEHAVASFTEAVKTVLSLDREDVGLTAASAGDEDGEVKVNRKLDHVAGDVGTLRQHLQKLMQDGATVEVQFSPALSDTLAEDPFEEPISVPTSSEKKQPGSGARTDPPPHLIGDVQSWSEHDVTWDERDGRTYPPANGTSDPEYSGT